MTRAELVTSRANPIVKRLRALRERRGAWMLLEGVTLVEEAMAARVTLLEVAASPKLGRTTRGRGLLSRLAKRGVATRWLADAVLASLSDLEVSQGVLAIAERPCFREAELFREPALLIAAFGVQDPGNLGALLRSAAAAGATGALVGRGCADVYSWKALRGSMGSAFRLPQLAGLEAAEVTILLRRQGVAALAASPRGTLSYDAWDWRRPSALLVGAEGGGLPPGIEAAAEAQVVVPMAKGVESLNVAAAAAVMLFEAARQRRLVSS